MDSKKYTWINNLAEIFPQPYIYWYSVINAKNPFKQLKYELEAKLQIFKNFVNKVILICQPASLPAVRPTSAWCMATVFLTTKVIVVYNTNLLFQLSFVICSTVITLYIHHGSFPFILFSTERYEFQEFNTCDLNADESFCRIKLEPLLYSIWVNKKLQ